MTTRPGRDSAESWTGKREARGHHPTGGMTEVVMVLRRSVKVGVSDLRSRRHVDLARICSALCRHSH